MPEIVIRDGKVAWIKIKPSDAMLRLLMQGANPEKYGRTGAMPKQAAARKPLKKVASKDEVEAKVFKALAKVERRVRLEEEEAAAVNDNKEALLPGPGGRAMSGGRAWRRRIVARLQAGVAEVALPNEEAEIEERKAELKRWVERVNWGLDHMDKLDRAEAAANAAWDRLEAEDPDGNSVPPEQIELERLLEDVDALIEHDRWPRHLYFKGI